ncbi:MAG: WXG100 family type VII secretion target [Coriobacteriales bacterium]|jgi:WXG100 family type VII secretion target|nr:WXG100 family type VII secretion target [Coriobacteriales bacterium]
MADIIAMTPQEMYSQATSFGTDSGTITEIIKKLDDQIVTLQNSWRGAAATQFAQRWSSDLKPSLEQASRLMTDIQSALTETARIMEQTDADIAKQFQS